MKPAIFKPADHFHKHDTFSMGIIGARRSGKSYMIKHLYRYYLKQQYHATFVYTSIANAPFYEEFIESYSEDGTVFTDPPPDDFLDIIDAAQAELQSRGKPKLRYLVIIDDLITDNMRHDENISEIFTRGRHTNMSIIFASQSTTALHPKWRGNLDYAVIFNVIRFNERDFLIKEYMGDMELPIARKLMNSRPTHYALIKHCSVDSNDFKRTYYIFNAASDTPAKVRAIIQARARAKAKKNTPK